MQIGFAGLLGIVFIALKLVGVIAWPWIWVLAPFWIPLGLGLIFLVVAGIISLFGYTKVRRNADRRLEDLQRSLDRRLNSRGIRR